MGLVRQKPGLLPLLALLITVLCPAAAQEATPALAKPFAISATTGEKPQSKLWCHAGRWWAVMPNASGTWVWRLETQEWKPVLSISPMTEAHADVKLMGSVVQILLFSAAKTSLVSIEYDARSEGYHAWTSRPAPGQVQLDAEAETATIEVDGRGRMWLASDSANEIRVRWSDPPYAAWNGPVTIAANVLVDDLGVVMAFPNGDVGVMWSNQATQRFGFRLHVVEADPEVWSQDEVPAATSALSVGHGMADDHMNCAVASDGTLYVAVKTSYDSGHDTQIGLLVRRPGAAWERLYELDTSRDATRPIALLDEAAGTITVIYALCNPNPKSRSNDRMVCRTSPVATIVFGPRRVLGRVDCNNPTSSKQSVPGEIAVMWSNAAGTLATTALVNPGALWLLNEKNAPP